MPTYRLQWEIVGATVDEDDLSVSEDRDLADRVYAAKQISREGGSLREVADALGPLTFEWSWSNCDVDPSEMFEDPQDPSFELNDTNSEMEAGSYRGYFVINLKVQFEIEVKPHVTPDSLNSWLDEHRVAICAFASGGWCYAGDEGQRVEVLYP